MSDSFSVMTPSSSFSGDPKACDINTVKSITDWRKKAMTNRSTLVYLSIATIVALIIIITIVIAYCTGRLVAAVAITGCHSYKWKTLNKVTRKDNVEPAGYDAQYGERLSICRLNVNGTIGIGKAMIELNSCWVPYEGKELASYNITEFEVLTNPKNLNFTWVQSDKGSVIPVGAIPCGSDTAQTTYVARCKWKSKVGDEVTPGTLLEEFYGIRARAMSFSFGGKVQKCEKFEVMTCV